MSFLQYRASELSSLLGSARNRYGDLKDFADNFPRQAADLVVNLGGNVRDEIIAQIEAELATRVPVRTGALLGSKSILRGQAPADRTRIGFSAPYAQVVERGRKRSKPYRRLLAGQRPGDVVRDRRGRFAKKDVRGIKSIEHTRMLGSRKAPRGYLKASWRAVNKKREAILTAAFAKTEAGS